MGSPCPETTDKTRWPQPGLTASFHDTTPGANLPVEPGSPSPDAQMPGAEPSLENLSDAGLEMESNSSFPKGSFQCGYTNCGADLCHLI